MQGQVRVACSPALFFFLQTRYAFIFVRSPTALFEILRSPKRNDGLTLEHSIGHISRENAGICPFSCFRQMRQDVPSKISPTQPDSSESAGFPRTSKIIPNQQDSFESDRLSLGLAASESSRHSPTASHHRATSPTAIHSRGLSRVASSAIKRHIGLSRVRGESIVGPRPLFIDCS